MEGYRLQLHNERLKELEDIKRQIMNGKDLPNWVYDRMNDLIAWTKS